VAASPELVQTGPAKRNDQPVIEKHLEILGSMPEYAEIYRLLARRIGKDSDKFHPAFYDKLQRKTASGEHLHF
jgi:predicted short-subunit dehydrogenase-like oxidoreductase (DUF2520 family)